MQKTFYTLFFVTFIWLNSALYGMESPTQINQLQLTQMLPEELVAQIAGYCRPYEKNIVMKLCKNFYIYLRNRELIVQANPATVSLFDKEKACLSMLT